MNRVSKIIVLLLMVFFSSGCITFHSVSYEINLNGEKGTCLISFKDFRTDASSKEELEMDKKNLFDYALKSEAFIKDMESEGKKIISRNLIVENNELNAIVTFEFKDVSNVEGIKFEDPYYYLTIPPEDSIISTNGQIIRTNEYKRIIWDKSMNLIRFKMFGEDTDKKELKSMAQYYLENK